MKIPVKAAPDGATKVQQLAHTWLLVNDRDDWFWPVVHHYWACGWVVEDDTLPYDTHGTVADALKLLHALPDMDSHCRLQIEELMNRRDARETPLWRG